MGIVKHCQHHILKLITLIVLILLDTLLAISLISRTICGVSGIVQHDLFKSALHLSCLHWSLIVKRKCGILLEDL